MALPPAPLPTASAEIHESRSQTRHDTPLGREGANMGVANGIHFGMSQVLPVHSPLLEQSQLLALPPLSDMLKFGGSFSVHQVTIDSRLATVPVLQGTGFSRKEGWGLTQTQSVLGDVSPSLYLRLSGFFLLCPWVSLSLVLYMPDACTGRAPTTPPWGVSLSGPVCTWPHTPILQPGGCLWGNHASHAGVGEALFPLSSFWSIGGEGQPQHGPAPAAPRWEESTRRGEARPRHTLWCGTPSLFSLSLSLVPLGTTHTQTHTSCGRGVGLEDRPVVGQTNWARCP